MKIGIFDSGLGGLAIAHAIRAALPAYDYLYLGDTLHVPYGRRSNEVIYTLTRNAVDYLFAQGCQLIVIACNTASAAALRRIQQTYLIENYPERRVLGVVVPTLETALAHGKTNIGLLATESVVQSNIYAQELKKINPAIRIVPQPAPLLVPLLENQGEKYLDQVLKDYLSPLLAENVDSLILGCTHYSVLKNKIRQLSGGKVEVLSQDEIIPEKLADYLRRHPETEGRLKKGGKIDFHVTDLTASIAQSAKKLFGEAIVLQQVAF